MAEHLCANDASTLQSYLSEHAASLGKPWLPPLQVPFLYQETIRHENIK